jgi:DNA processing protein
MARVTRAPPEYPRAWRSTIRRIVLYVGGTLIERPPRGSVVIRKTSLRAETREEASYQLGTRGHCRQRPRAGDTAAHQGALAAKGRTIAVIGSGLMDLYPPENRGIAEKVTESGAVVSEFPMTFPPDRQTFPYRNRIVAGWGQGLLVVEAGLNSGALITASQAIDHG